MRTTTYTAHELRTDALNLARLEHKERRAAAGGAGFAKLAGWIIRLTTIPDFGDAVHLVAEIDTDQGATQRTMVI